MATLKTDTFPSDKTGQQLLSHVKDALTKLTGIRAGKDGVYLRAPLKLNADRDELRPDYRIVWQQCTIEYDPEEAGAEVAPDTRTIHVGPFCLDLDVNDMEKIILHEYLHLVVVGWGSGDSQHPQINLIIRFNLNYPGPPNPANPAEE